MNNGLFGIAPRSSGLQFGLNGIQQNLIATQFRYGNNLRAVNHIYSGAYSAHTKLMYLTGYQQNFISIIDPATDSFIGSFPSGQNNTLGIASAGNKLFLTDVRGSTVIQSYNLDTGVNTAINVGAVYGGYGIKYFPTIDRVIVCGYTNQRIYIINPNTNALLSTITPAFSNPIDIIFCPTNNLFYVNDYANASITAYNSAFTLVTTITGVGTNPYTSIYCPLNDRIYVTAYTSSTVTVINPATNTIETVIPDILLPLGIYYNPIEQVIVVTSSVAGASSVIKIEPTSNTVISRQLVASDTYYSVYSGEFNKGYALQILITNPQIIYIE